jgi:hypothetical protein
MYLKNEGNYEVRLEIWKAGDGIFDESFTIKNIGVRDPEVVDVSFNINTFDNDDDNIDDTIEVVIDINYFLWDTVNFDVLATITEVDDPSNLISESENLGFAGPGTGSLQSFLTFTPHMQGDCDVRIEVWKAGDYVYDETIRIQFGEDQDSKIDKIDESDSGPSLPITFSNPSVILLSIITLVMVSAKRKK